MNLNHATPSSAASLPRRNVSRFSSIVLADVVGLGVVAATLALAVTAPNLHLRLSQEDDLLEWLTVGVFLAAALWFARAVRARARAGQRWWFVAGLAAFCLFVSMEEISWGQRLLGFRPPAAFLSHNVQQEMNLHNLAGATPRRLLLGAILAVHGLLLPLLAREPRLRAALDRAGLVPSPFTLTPLFGIALAVHVLYPVRLSGELVELALGLALLGGAFALAGSAGASLRAAVGTYAIIAAVTVGLTAMSRRHVEPAPQAITTAARELDALAADLARLAPMPPGDHHLRLRALGSRVAGARLADGHFARLARESHAPERAAHVLDPWNMSYWVKLRCTVNGECTGFVYSFGPNRARDTLGWDPAGDDQARTLAPAGELRPSP